MIPHGLNLSLGAVEGLDLEYLDALAALVTRIEPHWWSEHVSFTRAGGVEIGHLTPLPFTSEALDALCANIAEVRRRMNTPLILENITYILALPGAEMSEAEFTLAELSDRTEC